MKKLYSHGVNLGVIVVLVFSVVLINNVSAQTATTTTTTTTSKVRSVAVTSNYKFPRTVESVRGVGKNYVMQPFPTKVGEPLSYCDSTIGDTCQTWINEYKQNLLLGLNGPITINGNVGVNVNIPSKLPVFQYSAPFKKFVGRYFDGVDASWSDGVNWKRFMLPMNVTYVPGKNRIYISENYTIVAYNADTFFSAIANEPLKYFFRTFQGRFGHAAIPWETYFYPEDNGWLANGVDHGGFGGMNFDVDDRGYIYISMIHGFGVARDAGSTIKPVMQDVSMITDPDFKETYKTGTTGTNKLFFSNPSMAGAPLVFKANGKYYVKVGSNNASGYKIFDMTNPLIPVFVAEGGGAEYQTYIRIPLKTEEIIAAETNDSIEIYKASDFAIGGSPSKTFTSPDITIPGSSLKCEGYMGLTADNVSGKLYSFSCVKEGSGMSAKYPIKVSVFTPTNISDPTTYTETKYDLGSEMTGNVFGAGVANYFRPMWPIKFNNGYLIHADRIWIFKDGKPVELNTNNFINKYYQNPPEGYAASNSYNGYIDSRIVTYGGKDYFFYSTASIGDVYELEPVSRDNATTTTTPTTLTTIGTIITNLIECGLGHLFNYKTGALCSGASANTGGSLAPKVMDVKGPTSLNVGQAGTWTITATDPNSDDLSWSVDWGSGRSTASCKVNPGAGASKNWTYIISHSWLSPGAKTVTVYLDDCKGGKTTQTFTVTVGGGAGGGGDQQDQNAI